MERSRRRLGSRAARFGRAMSAWSGHAGNVNKPRQTTQQELEDVTKLAMVAGPFLGILSCVSIAVISAGEVAAGVAMATASLTGWGIFGVGVAAAWRAGRPQPRPS